MPGAGAARTPDQGPGGGGPAAGAGHPCAHIADGDFRQRTQTLGVALMQRHEGEEFGHIAPVGDDRIFGRILQRALVF